MTQQTTAEHVVLLDDQHRPTGTALKSEVHTEDTPLHLAFSCHVLNTEGQVMNEFKLLGGQTKWFCFSATLDANIPPETPPTKTAAIQWKFDGTSIEKDAAAAPATTPVQ